MSTKSLDPRQVIERQIELLNQQDLDGALEYAAENCEVREMIQDGQVLRGRGALRAYIEELNSGLSDISVELTSVLVDGNKAAAQLVLVGTHTGSLYGFPPTGRKVSYRSATFHTIEDGKSVLEEAYFDPAELLAGLEGA
jgi:steroid delta-isomerase-like uncharacterized protein